MALLGELDSVRLGLLHPIHNSCCCKKMQLKVMVCCQQLEGLWPSLLPHQTGCGNPFQQLPLEELKTIPNYSLMLPHLHSCRSSCTMKVVRRFVQGGTEVIVGQDHQLVCILMRVWVRRLRLASHHHLTLKGTK